MQGRAERPDEMGRADVRIATRFAGGALVAMVQLLIASNASFAQDYCKRYPEFEGAWQGTIYDEQIVGRYPQSVLGVPSTFQPDQRRLEIVYKGERYAVAWHEVQSAATSSIADDLAAVMPPDQVCAALRQGPYARFVRPPLPGGRELRVNIQGGYDNAGYPVRYQTKMCCVHTGPAAIRCVGFTNYRIEHNEPQMEKRWYDGIWQLDMTRPPLPNECGPQANQGNAPPTGNLDLPPAERPPAYPPGQSGF